MPTTPIIDVPESTYAPVPICRFVDNLIETYRDNTEILEKDELKINFPNTLPIEDKTNLKFTDVLREKNTRTNKKTFEALTEMSLDKPTPIQCACIPVALLHNDICACARTGCGKTLAFLLPILERLTKKPATLNRAVTRALVISPTRELAIQIYNVAEKLVKHCPKLRIQLAAGGLDLHSQEASLRLNPDLVVATPGRLIDHLSNTPNFNLQHIDFLVLDEADKLLDEYFTEQIMEIMKLCGKQRQILLFSATMTESVNELAILSLRDPVQIFLNEVTDVAQRLHQEFVRIRPHRETDRQSIVVALLARSCSKRTIVFMPTKRDCHRMHILLGLLGISCAELHGDLTQAQRIEALRRFSELDKEVMKDKNVFETVSSNSGAVILPRVDVLLATDLASRGLDIPNVETVINYNLPQTMKQYVHRVGRTARVMNVGRAVSLVVESDRKLLKQIMKGAPYPVKARVIPPDVIVYYQEKINRLQHIIEKILLAEVEERELRSAQSHLAKVEDLASNLQSGKFLDPSIERRKNWLAERKRNALSIGGRKSKRTTNSKKFKRN